jgi:hypothetical protein
MQTVLIILRAIHIFAGIAWAGSVFAGAVVTLPLIRRAGPAGASFFQDFTKQPRSIAFFAGASLLAVLSGIALFWLVYGFSGPWSVTQWAFAIGGVLALFSAALGGLVGRLFTPPPAGLPKDAVEFEARTRGMAAVLSLTVLLMATARYLG